jgi:hypothetical protein
LGCAIAGFMTMNKGAICVLKQYTFFEPITYSLLIIYSSLFEKFYISKPLTSRPYNSEVYLVGVGFLGFDDKVRKILLDKLKNWDILPVVKNTEEDLDDIKHFATVLSKQQIDQINEIINIFQQNPNGKLFMNLKSRLFDEWLKKYPILYITDDLKLKSNT